MEAIGLLVTLEACAGSPVTQAGELEHYCCRHSRTPIEDFPSGSSLWGRGGLLAPTPLRQWWRSSACLQSLTFVYSQGHTLIRRKASVGRLPVRRISERPPLSFAVLGDASRAWVVLSSIKQSYRLAS